MIVSVHGGCLHAEDGQCGGPEPLFFCRLLAWPALLTRSCAALHAEILVLRRMRRAGR